MKVSIRNLGVIKEADISIGDLTVLCGWNNTGKTYVSSVLFGFLDKFWQNEVVLPLAFEILDSLRKNNEFLLTEEITRKAIGGAIKAVKEKFSNSEVFAEDIPGEVDLITEERDDKRVLLRQELNAHDIADAIAVVGGGKGVWKFKVVDKGLVADKDAGSILAKGISNFLKKEAYFAVLPRPFVASCERTGAMIFNADISDVYKTAYFEMGDASAAEVGDVLLINERSLKKHEYMKALYKTKVVKVPEAWIIAASESNLFFRRKYPLPVGFDVFINRPAPLLPQPGSFAGLRPDILEALNGIVGGVFEHKDGKILFKPQVSEGKASLGSGTVSSSVRALFDLVIFLHVASPGDLLIIDEPEMNLHPRNQRLLARFLVRLCNAGVKVFISTHSDYILREFSILIRLDSLSEEPRKAIAEKYGYAPDEGLNHESCRVYRAVPKEKIGGVVFDSVSITPEFGIDGSVFDEVIEEMNAISSDILCTE